MWTFSRGVTWKGQNRVIIDGVSFDLRPTVRFATNPEWICLRKPRYYIERYLAVAKEFRGCRMVEVGIDQGGSTAFFKKLLKPELLLGIELVSEPPEQLQKFLAEHDPGNTINVHWGVDQADTEKLSALVDASFGAQALDLVVDDASHLYEPTITTFETLFPRLRPGGLYIIEDWSGLHEIERRMAEQVASDPDGEFAQVLRATDNAEQETLMSYFISQLVIVPGIYPELISEVTVSQGVCQIRRGPGEIKTGTPFSSYIGKLAGRMFERNG